MPPPGDAEEDSVISPSAGASEEAPVEDELVAGAAASVEAKERALRAEVTDTQGTPAFFPPEACSAAGGGHREASQQVRFDAFKQDAWAAGVTLYCLLFGYHPFASEETPTAEELFQRIGKGTADLPRRAGDGAVEHLEVPLSGNGAADIAAAEKAALAGTPDDEVAEILADSDRLFVSPQAEELLVLLLAADPDKRLSVQQAMDHAWVQTDHDRQFTECPAIDLSALEPYESLIVD